MYKYKLWYDGGFLRDSEDLGYVFKTEEAAMEDAKFAKECYMEDWDIEGSEYEEDLFVIETIEI